MDGEKMQVAVLDKRYPVLPLNPKNKQRYELILDCAAEAMLKVLPESLSIPQVAKAAQLPPQAVYRLFPSSTALIHGLADRYLQDLYQHIAQDLNGRFDSWQEAWCYGVEYGAAYYNSYPQAMELILGAAVSRESRTADRANTQSIAELSAKRLASYLPQIDAEVFVVRIEIAMDLMDAVFSRSYFKHAHIDQFHLEEAKRASLAYMANYIPQYPL